MQSKKRLAERRRSTRKPRKNKRKKKHTRKRHRRKRSIQGFQPENGNQKLETNLWHIKKGKEHHAMAATRIRSGWDSRLLADNWFRVGPLSCGSGVRV